jgi:hypothetical protein
VAEQIDRADLPAEVLQILLEPPPGQPAGQHPVQEQDGSRIRHLPIEPNTGSGTAKE